MRLRIVLPSLLAVAAVAMAATTEALAAPSNLAREQSEAQSAVALSGARVSMLANGRIVASFDASGDVRGLLTVTIDRNAKGALSGEWVLVSRYVRDLNANGEVDDRMISERAALPGSELHALHNEYIDIHEGGSVRGSITGGTLAFDVDGALVGIDSLQLSIGGGNLGFDGARGTGSLSASQLRDVNGTGTLQIARVTTSTEGVK